MGQVGNSAQIGSKLGRTQVSRAQSSRSAHERGLAWPMSDKWLVNTWSTLQLLLLAMSLNALSITQRFGIAIKFPFDVDLRKRSPYQWAWSLFPVWLIIAVALMLVASGSAGTPAPEPEMESHPWNIRLPAEHQRRIFPAFEKNHGRWKRARLSLRRIASASQNDEGRRFLREDESSRFLS